MKYLIFKGVLLFIAIFSYGYAIGTVANACDENDLTPETINFKLYKPCMSTHEGTNYCKK